MKLRLLLIPLTLGAVILALRAPDYPLAAKGKLVAYRDGARCWITPVWVATAVAPGTWSRPATTRLKIPCRRSVTGRLIALDIHFDITATGNLYTHRRFDRHGPGVGDAGQFHQSKLEYKLV